MNSSTQYGNPSSSKMQSQNSTSLMVSTLLSNRGLTEDEISRMKISDTSKDYALHRINGSGTQILTFTLIPFP